MSLHTYIAQDRRRALAAGRALPVSCHGAALFSDVSGFTRLTEALALGQGPRRGVDELVRRLNAVHQALIDEVARCGGSVVAFAGDGMTCWFDDADAPQGSGVEQAARAARAMQRTMKAFPELGIKIGVAAGAALRVAAGDASIQLIDLLAGATVARALRAEALAAPGEVVVDAATARTLPPAAVGPARLDAAGEACHPHLFGASDAAGPDAGPAASAEACPGAQGRAQGRDGARDKARDEARAQAAAWPDAEALRPWVLPVVWQRETASQGLFATGLRPATALFLRLALGAEPLQGDGHAQAQALAEAVALAQRELQQHGGVLLEASLDAQGLSLYGNFGAAQVHEDDPARALRAALALSRRFDAAGLAPRIGVASGTLCVGGYGGLTRRSFGAVGNEVNSAARLMAQARPGEILVSGRVRQLAAGDEVDFEPRAPIALKGKAEPMAAFAAQPAAPRRVVRLQEPPALLPLVGRAAEQALLAEALAQAQGGRRQALRIVAEPGMGKSRLVAEGIRLARRAGFLCYGGASRADGVRMPYRLWQGVWTAFFDHDPALPPRRQAQALQAALRQHAPEHADAWPLLGAVLGAELPDTPFTAALQPQDRKALLEALLLRCLLAAADEAAQDGLGLLLVLEDLHAADPLSLALLGVLVRGSATRPLLVLATERPGHEPAPPGAAQAVPEARSDGTAPPAAADDAMRAITLRALAEADVAQIVRAKLALRFPERADAVPAALLERVAARAQGNPFFAEQLLDSLHDRGIDPRRPEALAALELPGTLHSVVLSRIDRLSPTQQNPLKAASVIGREFGLEELAGYCPRLGPQRVVAEALQALARQGFTPALPDAAARRHAFCHAVMREVCYESIGLDTRAELHDHYARYLSASIGGLPADAPEAAALASLLAHHLERAGHRALAARQHRLAAGHAAARFANDEALAHLAAALEAWPPEDLAGQFALRVQHQAILELQGRHAQRRREIEVLDQLAPRLPDAPLRRAQVATLRAALHIALGEMAQACTHAQAALQALQPLYPVEADEVGEGAPGHSPTGPQAEAAGLRVEALLLQAQALLRGGDPVAARPLLEAALAQASARGLRRAQVTALSRIGHLHWHAGEMTDAGRRLGQALALAADMADLRAQLDILNSLGVVAKARRRFGEALSHYQAALQIARRIGDRPGEAMLLNNLGSACLAAGRFHEAGRHCAQAEAMFAESGELALRALALTNRGEAHRELGQPVPALALSAEALAVVRASGLRPIEAAVLENLGLAEAAAGRPEAARARLREAAQLSREIDWPAREASALLHLGQLSLGQLHQGQQGSGRSESGGAPAPDEAEGAAALDAAERLAAGLGDELLTLELQAAQARRLLAGGAAAAARARLDSVLPHLLPNPLAPGGAAEAPDADAVTDAATADAALPLGLYATVLQVLAACGDPAAPALREQARRELLARTERIPDAAARRDFADRPEHRALLA